MRLRPFKPQDIDCLMKWIPDNERDFTMWSADRISYPPTRESLSEYYASYVSDDSAWFMTALSDLGDPVGCLLMRKADYKSDSIHFGFIIVDRRLKIRGLGKEMLSLAIKYAFEILNMKRVTLGVFALNERALGCYKSVGMREEAYHKGEFEYKDEKWDLIDMAIGEELHT